MNTNIIYNEDNRITIKERIEDNSIDCILTSPFYNTSKKAGTKGTLLNVAPDSKYYPMMKYDVFVDNMSNSDYAEYCKELFCGFDRILKPNGSVLWNMSYGSENTECLFFTIAKLLAETNFTIADIICWKKKSAMPQNTSKNRLTRIWEMIFVFCRKEEEKTFFSNKRITSVRESGQAMYENIFNFIEAKNNDGSCPLNKATFSSDLVNKLLSIYCPKNGIVYDPFMGTGTTAVGCKQMGIQFIGSELSKQQCEWAEDRLQKVIEEKND